MSVQIATDEAPQVGQFQPVTFDGLVARCTVGRDGKLRQYWSASGVKGNGKPSPKPEHHG